MSARAGERRLRDEADELAFEHVDADRERLPLHGGEGHRGRRARVVGQVHRDLYDPSFRERETERLDPWQPAVAFAHLRRDPPRNVDARRGQVHIERDEHPARPDNERAGGGVEPLRIGLRDYVELLEWTRRSTRAENQAEAGPMVEPVLLRRAGLDPAGFVATVGEGNLE